MSVIFNSLGAPIRILSGAGKLLADSGPKPSEDTDLACRDRGRGRFEAVSISRTWSGARALNEVPVPLVVGFPFPAWAKRRSEVSAGDVKPVNRPVLS